MRHDPSSVEPSWAWDETTQWVQLVGGGSGLAHLPSPCAEAQTALTPADSSRLATPPLPPTNASDQMASEQAAELDDLRARRLRVGRRSLTPTKQS